jgi:CheY-like chemotaxis protein
VDDEPGVLLNLRAYLEDEGMQVRGAASAEEALELLRQGTNFDVCVMDMRLPGMHGDAAIRSLHGLRPNLKYVIHTGTAGYELPDDLRTLGVGNDQLFMKPLPDMEPLVAAIRKLGLVG